MYITRNSSGIASDPITKLQLNNPQDSPVVNPCIKIVDATKRTKNIEHKKYDGTGRSPRASRIHDTSQENATK